MGQVIILPETTKQPITTIGKMAGVCWGADTTDAAKNYKRGWNCIESGHGRTEEFPDVYMELDGYSARVIREWYTHVGGMPTRLQASTRYINYGNFEYIVPPSIENNADALKEYMHCMDHIAFAARKLESIDIPREDAAMLLPLAMRRQKRHSRACNAWTWAYTLANPVYCTKSFDRRYFFCYFALYNVIQQWRAIVTKGNRGTCCNCSANPWSAYA